jgi:hypothetical protein
MGDDSLRTGAIWYRYSIGAGEDLDSTKYYEYYRIREKRGKVTVFLETSGVAHSTVDLDWLPFSLVKGIYKRSSRRIRLTGRRGQELQFLKMA